MSANELIALAERVEALTGPCRIVSDKALRACGWTTQGAFIFKPDGSQHVGVIPDPTASLDAAMSLVPDDYDWAVFRTNGGLTVHAWCGNRNDVFAATPALALTAAALRARAAMVS